MSNIFNYIEKYGQTSFKEKEFNDIDNLVFSLLSYLDFTQTSVNNGRYSLEYIGQEYLTNNTYKDVKKIGIAQKDAYKLLKIVIRSQRYKNIKVLHYIYNTNKEMQFSAVTFKISNRLKYICFEGTDQLVSGWKEDGNLACFFPVPSHIEAIKYANKHVNLFGSNVIIGGHSKGGNLALIAAMYMKRYKKFKIKKVYNNDGPGLRKKEFESSKYKKIKKKYIHFVPEFSIVGILLRNDIYNVIKATKKNIYAHAISTWIIEEDKLVSSELSIKSQRMEQSIISWLDKYEDKERIKFVNNIFKILEDLDIGDLNDAKKIENIFKITFGLKNLDEQTKKILIDLLKYNSKNVLGINN